MNKFTFLWNDFQPHSSIATNLIALKKFDDIVWNNLSNVFQISKKNHIYCFHGTKDLEKDVERGEIYLDKEERKSYFEEIENHLSKTQKEFDEIKNVDVKNLSDKELLSLINKLFVGWEKTISYFRSTQEQGTRKLVTKISGFFKEQNLTMMMTSPMIDLAGQELLDWQELLKKDYSEELLKKHIAKYPWTVMCHFSEEDQLQTYKERYNFDKKNPSKMNILEEKEALKKKQEKLMNEEFKDDLKAFHHIAGLRMSIKATWAAVDYYLIPLIEELSKRTDENNILIHKLYLPHEMEELLLQKKKVSKEELDKRKEFFLGYFEDGEINYFSGLEAEEIAKKELGKLYIINDSQELKGQVANPGKVQGIAMILPCNDVEKTRYLRKNFKQGEILVTGMTQPNIMDIASKAAAIITDEGGMLSHAAIISREFKIPCIVGTRFATQILKDGDKIEVDANSGIITKL